MWALGLRNPVLFELVQQRAVADAQDDRRARAVASGALQRAPDDLLLDLVEALA